MHYYYYCYSIEGEGFLYDGERKVWPTPHKWTQEKIVEWMVSGTLLMLTILQCEIVMSLQVRSILKNGCLRITALYLMHVYVCFLAIVYSRVSMSYIN